MHKFFRKWYRKLWDFPRNWKPYGWTFDQMTEYYWSGSQDIQCPCKPKIAAGQC